MLMVGMLVFVMVQRLAEKKVAMRAENLEI